MLKKKSCNKKGNRKGAPIVEQLSPRVLYSADPFGLSSDLVLPEDSTQDSQISLDNALATEPTGLSAIDDELLTDEFLSSNNQTRTEVIFVNTSVDDYQQIVDSLTESSDDEVNYVIYTLDSSQSIDDVDQMLANHQQLDALHFITHGSDGLFNLGSSIVSNETLASHSDSFEQWGAALAEEGDILFYGCNLAETAEGQQLVAAIANATNADVGASDNLTGHESLNADWRLEFSVGKIDTDESRMAKILNNWESHLQSITVTVTADVVNGDTSSVTNLINDDGGDGISLREALLAANTDSDLDTITLGSGTFTLDSGTLNIANSVEILGTGINSTTIAGDLNPTNPDRLVTIFDAGQVTLSNLSFENGDAINGGAIFTQNTELTLESIGIHNNQADQRGGGLFVESGTVDLNNVEISENNANSFGGGIYINTGTVNFDGGEISNNSAFQFEGNQVPAGVQAQGQGGGVYINTGTAHFNNNVVISQNSADLQGGGLYVNTGTANLNNVDITDNNVELQGGGIYINSGQVNFDGGEISRNDAPEQGTFQGQGGGVYLNAGNAQLNLNDVEIMANRAGQQGGGIYVNAGLVNSSEVTISNNLVRNQGGGLYLSSGGEFNAITTDFINNQTVTPVVGTGGPPTVDEQRGGAAFIEGTLNLTQSEVRNNLAFNGGGIFVAGTGTAAISDSSFTSNRAVNAGGAINTSTQGTTTIDRSLIRMNDAQRGGGVNSEGTTTISDSTISGNTAFFDGSAARADNDNGNTNALIEIIRSTIADNEITGTTNRNVIDANDATVTIQSSLLSRNLDINGNIALLDSDIISLGNNLYDDLAFVLPSSSVTFSDILALGPLTAGLDTILQDLGSIEPSVLTYALLPGSLAIGNGTGTNIVDITGANRGNAPDIGAFEFRQPDVTTGPSLVANNELNLNPGDTRLIFFPTLNAVDPDTPAENIEYLVRTTPLIGSLQNNGVILTAGDTFTQADINAGNISFTSDFSGQDSFMFDVDDLDNDATNASLNHVFNINISGMTFPPMPALTITSPPQITLEEDDNHIFVGSDNISIDLNTGSDTTLQVLLEANNGTLSLSSTTNLNIISGNDNTSSILIEGLRSDINAALDGLQYTPDPNYHGNDILTLTPSINVDRELHFSFENNDATDDNFGTNNNGNPSANANISNEQLTLNGDGYITVPGTDFGITDSVTFASQIEVNTAASPGPMEIISLNDVIRFQYDSQQNELKGSYSASTTNIPQNTRVDLTPLGINLADGNTHHVAYTIDTSNGLQALYVDGQRVHVTLSSEPLLLPSPQNAVALIGAFGNTQDFRFNGNLDDVQIFSRALSDQEIALISSDNQEVTSDVNITVESVNDAPTFNTTLDGNPTFTENGSSVILDLDVQVFDAELSALNSGSGDFGGATLTIERSGGANSDDVFTAAGPLSFGTTDFSLSGVKKGTFTSSIAGRIELTFDAGVTNDEVNQVMRSLQYSNSSDTPPASVSLAWTFDENNNGSQGLGGALQANGITTVSITPVNDAPTLANIEVAPASFTEGGSAIGITANLSLDDLDDVNIESSIVAISGNLVTGDILNFANQNGINGNYNAANGTLTLTGSASLSDYQAALRSITYENTGDDPSDLTRTVSILISDGDDDSNIVSRDINIIAVNDAPTLSNIEAVPASYTEGGSAVGITGNLSLDDLDDINIESAVVSISNNFATGEDELIFTDQFGITGSFDAVNGTLTLTGSASVADYQTALTTIAYNNTSANPSTLTRTVSFEINDGDLSSNVLSRDIEITAVNDAPVLSAIETAPASYTENDAPLAITSSAAVSDVDDNNIESAVVSISSNFSADDVLNFTDQSGITGNYDSVNGTLTLTGSASLVDYQAALQSITYVNTSDDPSDLTRTVSFLINDSDVDSNIVSRDIDFTAVNDAPTTTLVTLTAIAEDSGARLITQADLLANANDIEGDALIATGLTINTGNGAITDNGNGTWNYTPAANDETDVSFNYTITDGTNNVAGTATLDITPVNDAPTFETRDPTAFTTNIITDTNDGLVSEGVVSAYATDIDLDGDLDLVTSAIDGGVIAWQENDGTGNFTTRTVENNVQGVFQSTTADINEDGHQDIISAVSGISSSSTGTINWYQNDGNQVFNRIVIDNNLTFVRSVTTDDVDDDGDIDVLAATGDGILWYENDGSDNPNFLKHTISTVGTLGRWVTTTDVDGDGDLDVVSADVISDSITWHENDGNQNFTDHTVTASADGVRSLAVADVDSDGDNDLLSASNNDNTIAWYENDGSGNFVERTISNSAIGAFGVTAADIDNDGDIDVLSAARGAETYYLYENDGTENFTSHIIDDNTANTRGAFSITTGDFNNDGTLDVATAARVSDTIALYENTGGFNTTLDGNPTFTEDGSPVTLDLDVQILDAELSALNSGSGDFGGTTLTIERSGGANSDDVFTAAGPLSFGTTDFSLSGVKKGTFTSSIAGRIELTFDAGVTNDEVNQVMRSLQYSNSSDTPPASVTLAWTLDDNNNGTQGTGGALQANGNTTVNITAVNDTPTTIPVALTAIDEDSGARLITQAQLLTNAIDIDGNALTATGLTINTGNGVVTDNGNGTWNYTPAANDETDVSFNYTITDGTDNVAGTATLDITPVNDAQTTTSVTLTAIAEDSGARLITQAELLANAIDIEGDALTATGLTINTGNGALADNGDGTWSYTPVPNDDTEISFNYIVTDGTDNTAATATLDITTDNDAPTIPSLEASPLQFTEGDAPLITTIGIDLEDVDNPNLESATISISNNFVAGEDELTFDNVALNSLGISAVFDDSTGILSLTGIASVENYQQAIRLISYVNDSENPSDLTREISYTISDGIDSTTRTRTLQVIPLNDPPVIEDAQIAAINEDATLATPLSILDLFSAGYSDLDGTPALFGIVVTENTAPASEGFWQYSIDGSAWFNIDNVSDSQALVLSNNTFIRFSPAADFHGTPQDLVVRPLDGIYSGPASTSNNAADRITIDTTTPDNRIGAPQSIATEVNAINDAPVAFNASLATITEDTSNPTGELIASLITTATDVDIALDPTHTLVGIAITQNNEPVQNGSWQYQDNNGVWQNIGTVSSDNALLLDTSTSIRFLPQADYSGTPESLSAHVVDSSFSGNLPAFIDARITGGETPFSNQINISTNVSAVNDAPTQLTLAGNLEITENTAVDNIGAVTFTDVDNNDTQEISVNDDRFEVVNGSLALRPGVTLDHESEPEVALQITVSDDAGATATHDVILQVLDVNESPVLVEQIEDQTSTEPFSFTLPESAFTDDDGDPLTLSATRTDGTELPEWIQFADGTFTITDDAPAESVDVLVTATDPEGLSASTPITISIEPPIEQAVRSPQLTNPEPIAPPPPVETTEDSQVVASLSEETDEPSDSESSLGSSEEIFDASAISISESNEEPQQQLSEVIQLQTLSSTQMAEAINKVGLDVELANEFNVLLTDSVNIEAQARQTNAANIATLQKLASEADKNQTLLANSQIISPQVLATSATISSGFSVGYILWLLRGGTLLASVMASMPAWRAIDPLPVLQSLTDDDDDDTETLQSMVEEQEPQESADQADTETKTPGKAA